MSREWWHRWAPDVLLWAGAPLVILSVLDWARPWARPLGLTMGVVGAVWLTTRTVRVMLARRRAQRATDSESWPE
ncbi:hypothetical protein [Nocardioides sp.]|uniref:hypothetical protein n=1 Tax=Nocardioides sp. TaxID=35761 RepID=UPI000C98F278|nr:hypothetical protein [Pimelobacter sp.]